MAEEENFDIVMRGYDRDQVDKNIDECVLCRLCLDAAPEGAVTIIKRYDNDSQL
jgi:NAD-dependent dihydropyrimidine dehydrogenase PreA subunit